MENLKHSVKFLGKITKDAWECFAWRVTINGIDFDYNMGLAHFTPYRDKYGEKYNSKPKDIKIVANSELQGYLHAPDIMQVLEALLSDSDAGSQSFDDFCANFGYDNDSLKALDTYRACMAIGPKVRQALGPNYNRIREEIEAKNAC